MAVRWPARRLFPSCDLQSVSSTNLQMYNFNSLEALIYFYHEKQRYLDNLREECLADPVDRWRVGNIDARINHTNNLFKLHYNLWLWCAAKKFNPDYLQTIRNQYGVHITPPPPPLRQATISAYFKPEISLG